MDLVQISSIQEASYWVWDQLWKIDKPHISFEILDAIRLSHSQVISWIFTMVDGKIKSKSKGRWTISSVIERCLDSEGQFCAHALVDDCWVNLPKKDYEITENMSAIICMAHVREPFLFIEVIFEKQNGISGPKVLCYRLCAASVLGQAVNNVEGLSNLIPTNRLQITNKDIIAAMKEKISELIRLLEQQSRLSIQKISSVFVLEDFKSSTSRSEFKIKFHHSNEIHLTKKIKSSRQGISGAVSESGQTDVTEITNSSRGYVHRTKCEGDFCSFNPIDEGDQLQLADELDFNITREKSRAVVRNRRIDGIDEEALEDNDIRRANILAAITSHSPRKISSESTGPISQHLLQANQSYRIPVKSLLLARAEMKLIDETYKENSIKFDETKLQPELRHWSPLLLNWYQRVGRPSRQDVCSSVPIPASAGHSIAQTLLQPSNSHVSEQQETKGIRLTSKTLKQLSNGETISSGSNDSRPIPFDLNDNPYHNSDTMSSKHLGRYYSAASVCERCYYTYKELDRLRKQEVNAALRSKKSDEEDLKHSDNSEYLYHRMNEMNKFVDQRVNTYRLAQSKNPRKDDSLENINKIKSTSNTVGPPKGVLPPLPWQLREAEKRVEYQQQGGSFIRNIQTKAQSMMELAAQKKWEESDQIGTEINLEPNFDWRKQVVIQNQGNPSYSEPMKSKSAGHQPKRKKTVRNIPRKFDHERLLHPHQRYFEQIKRQNLEGEKSEINEHSQPVSNKIPTLNQKSYSTSLLPVMESLDENYLPHQSSLPPLVPKKKSEIMKVKSPSKNNSLFPAAEPDSVSDEDDDDCIGWSPFVISSN